MDNPGQKSRAFPLPNQTSHCLGSRWCLERGKIQTRKSQTLGYLRISQGCLLKVPISCPVGSDSVRPIGSPWIYTLSSAQRIRTQAICRPLFEKWQPWSSLSLWSHSLRLVDWKMYLHSYHLKTSGWRQMETWTPKQHINCIICMHLIRNFITLYVVIIL